MGKKFTLKEVKSYFEEQGCKLLAEEYINNATPMPYICSCGKKSKISLGNFKEGNRCKQCGFEKAANKFKLPFEEVKAYFDEQGCTLLATEYLNYLTSMPYICSCGKKSKITLGNFKAGKRCKKCGIDKMQKSQRFHFEEVKAYFEEQGCKLLVEEYINNATPMSYVCNCGEQSVIIFNDFKAGKRCKKCGIAKQKESTKLPFEEVKAYFDEQGCTLLATEYSNNSTPMPYICSCGKKSMITLGHLQRGQKCNECKPKSKGEDAILNYFQEHQIKFEPQYGFRKSEIARCKFDFSIFELLIEYQGKQHYCPYCFGSKKKHAKQKNLLWNIKSDNKKLSWCRQHKIPLLLIPYWDYNRISEILDDVLAGGTPTFSEPPEIVKKHEPFRKKIRDYLGITEKEVLCGLIKSSKENKQCQNNIEN